MTKFFAVLLIMLARASYIHSKKTFCICVKNGPY